MEAFGLRAFAARVLRPLGLRLLFAFALRPAARFEVRPSPFVLALRPALSFEPRLVLALALRLEPRPLLAVFALDLDLRELVVLRVREPLELRLPAPPPSVEAKPSTASLGTSIALRAPLAAFSGALARGPLRTLRLRTLPTRLATTGTRMAVPAPTARPLPAATRRRELS